LYTGTLGRGSNCDLSYIGTLAFTVGTQVSTYSTYKFADQVTVTEGGTTADWISESAADNRVAEASIDLQGDDTIIVVPIQGSLSADAKLLVKFY
jgi:hypothetical protein